MSRTCHCCEQSDSSCAPDYCSPWAMTLRGPTIYRRLEEEPIEKYYEFGCEFNQDSFIWNLKPELKCDNPIYFQKNKGVPDWYWQYVSDKAIFWDDKGYYSSSFFLTMTKIFYINSNTNVNISIKAQQNKVPLSTAVAVAPLRDDLCNALINCCGFSNNGVCFYQPMANLSLPPYYSMTCPDSLYSRCIIKSKAQFPKFSYYNGFKIANSLSTEDINCNNNFNADHSLNFNTAGCGGYYYIQIRIKAEDNFRATKLPNNKAFDLIHGYENFGAVKIEGINPYVCARFSKMMMTSNDILRDATTPGFPDYMGNSCFSEPFFTKSYIDADILRNRDHRAEMRWGFETDTGNGGSIMIDPRTGQQLGEDYFYPEIVDMFYPYDSYDCDVMGIAPQRD